jgi:hypothetical protein
MRASDSLWSEIKGAGSEDTAYKRPLERRVPRGKQSHLCLVEGEQDRGEDTEQAWETIEGLHQ